MQHQPLIFTKGLNSSTLPRIADKDSLSVSQNVRMSLTQFGVLELSPRFYTYLTLSSGSYYDGGVLSDTTAVTDMFDAAIVTGNTYRAWLTGNVIQTFYQSTNNPTTHTIYTGCRLVINSVASLAINLGSSLDVEMTGTAAFRWRKNGGAWTAGVPSTSGVSIDAGNATLYFLASTGFAGTETWTWTRYDSCSNPNATGQRQLARTPSVRYGRSIFFFDKLCRLMEAPVSSAALPVTNYIISAGYRPVYGTSVTVFSDHLVIGQFSPIEGNGSIFGTDIPRTVGWSDKVDVWNFIPTDVNEADSKILDNIFGPDFMPPVGTNQILSVFVLQKQLFVITNLGLFSTADIGLPLVFSFGYSEFGYIHSVVVAATGVYLLSRYSVLFYNGGELRDIGQNIRGQLPGTGPVYGVYDTARQELLILNQGNKTLYCYQELFRTWYTRLINFGATSPVVTLWYNSLYASGSSTRVLLEDPSAAQTPVFDDAAGTTFAVPTLRTQQFGNALSNVCEVSSAYIGAIAASGPASGYWATTNIVLKLYWYTSNVGSFDDASATTHSSATWTTSKPDGLVSFPRIAYRTIAFEVRVEGTDSTKPAAGVSIYGLEFEQPEPEAAPKPTR